MKLEELKLEELTIEEKKEVSGGNFRNITYVMGWHVSYNINAMAWALDQIF